MAVKYGSGPWPAAAFLHCQQSSAQRAVSQSQNTMAVKYGSGPRPAAHTAKRCFLNCLKTSLRPSIRPPSCTASKAPLKGRSRRAKTPWQWSTDHARGRERLSVCCLGKASGGVWWVWGLAARSAVPNVAFCTCKDKVSVCPCLTLLSAPVKLKTKFLSVCLSVCQSVRPSICVSVCLCLRRILLRRAPPASGWVRRIPSVCKASVCKSFCVRRLCVKASVCKSFCARRLCVKAPVCKKLPCVKASVCKAFVCKCFCVY